MRVGFNPNKDKQIASAGFYHQVIVPVYIPHFEGYFKDSFQILQYCLTSLFKTSHSKTYFTVVNNGSCKEVVLYLNDLFLKGQIHELIHVDAIGKLNAILKGLVGQKFEVVTISDSDVLFLNNWQTATYSVFESFPKAGAVCTTPSSRSLRTYTANLYWDTLFSKKIQISKVVNSQALKDFSISVGNENFYNENQLQYYLTIESKGVKAVAGAGHFVCTYRKEVFQSLNRLYTTFSLGGDSEASLLDIPVVANGLWRLSTADNYTYHMGNVTEPWMNEQVEKLTCSETEMKINLFPFKRISNFENILKNRIFSKFILNKTILRYFLVWKGLPKKAAKNYLT